MSKVSDIDDRDLEDTSIEIHDLLLIYIQKRMDAKARVDPLYRQ
jgi:hypothetical protein